MKTTCLPEHNQVKWEAFYFLAGLLMGDRITTFIHGGWKHFMRVAVQGLFWLAPMVAVVAVTLWLYDKIEFLTGKLFELLGFDPERFVFLWVLVGLLGLLCLAYLVGHLVETRLGRWTENLLQKIPGYNTMKDLINIFNSSKKGEQQVLVVMVKGFATQGYNIGLMYSQKESILKDHYTVTLSQTPIPNGGYMFEVHQDNIWVIREASFDHNLQYLLSMGVKSLPEIINIPSVAESEMCPLCEYLAEQTQETPL